MGCFKISFSSFSITEIPLGKYYLLGNILNVVTDRKLPVADVNDNTKVAYFTADVVSYSDYLPFGQVMPNRHGYSGTKYRYGFQKQEVDDELKGEDNSVNYKFRMHDPRLGRFFAVDPLSRKYPWNSPYAFSENRIINSVELEGLEDKVVVRCYDPLNNYLGSFYTVYKDDKLVHNGVLFMNVTLASKDEFKKTTKFMIIKKEDIFDLNNNGKPTGLKQGKIIDESKVENRTDRISLKNAEKDGSIKAYTLRIAEINYENANQVSDVSTSDLNQLNLYINGNPEFAVIIKGHASGNDGGSEANNVSLSRLRARDIADSFAKKGVNEDKMTVSGVGSSEPKPGNTNSTKEEQKANRRVEVVGTVPRNPNYD